MALIKSNEPTRSVATFPRTFSDMLDRFFDEAVKTGAGNFVPTVDVKENENSYEVEATVPGVKKDDINVEVDGQTLHISGEKQNKEEDNDKTYHRVESEYGYFHRSFTLPDNAKLDDIEANYEDGVLRLTIPKDEEKTETKKIEVK